MKIYNIQKLAIFISVFLLASALFFVGMKLTLPLSYPDFISGYVTLTNGTKFQDLVVMPIVLFGSFLFFAFLMKLFKKLSARDAEESKKLSFQIVLWSLSGFLTIVSFLNHKQFDELIFIPFIGILILLLASYFFANRHIDVTCEKVSISLLMVFFLGLLPLSLSIVFNILPFNLTGGGIASNEIKKWILSVFSIGLAGHIYFTFFKSNSYNKALSRLVLISQIGLSLLFCRLYPARLLEMNTFTAYKTSFLLEVLIILLLTASIGDIFYRYVKYAKTNFTFKLISPLAIVALLIFIDMGWNSVPNIKPDDFHFGEKILGWWSYLQGYIPYVDYMPPHGLISDDISGFLNMIFYDGTASSLDESGRLASALFTIIGFLSIFSLTKSLLITTIIIYPNSGNLAWLFLFPFIALWFNKTLIENKIRWLISWLITAPILILGLPPQGLLLVAASSIIPFYYLSSMIKNKEWIVLKTVITWFAIILIIYLITPLGEMLFSAIQYVFINGPINQIAHGIPWTDGGIRGVIFETIRMSWVLVSAVMLFTLHYLYQNKLYRDYYVLPALITLIYALLLIPYTMGRIEPVLYCRPSNISMLLITGFMTPILWNLLDKYNRIWLIISVAAVTLILKGTSLSLPSLIQSSSSYIKVDQLTNTDGTLLANIGKAKIQVAHWKRLNKLATLLDEKLEPKESYLDLTSRNAHYFYFNRKPLITISAPYNMPSPIQQKNAIKRLEKNLPRLALLEAENSFGDSGGFALRNHYLYRFIIDNYEPYKINGFIIGLSKEAIKRGDWGAISLPNKSQKVDLFEQAFSRNKVDYSKLPVSWGGSIKTLSSKMDTVIENGLLKPLSFHDVKAEQENSYKITGNNPFIVFDLSKYNLSGKKAGLMKFDFTCKPQFHEPRIQIYWTGEEGVVQEKNSLFFTANNGTLLIPIDSAPRWYLLNEIKSIRIRLFNAEACETISIKNLSLHQRN